MNIEFTRRAQRDLDEIFSYLLLNSPQGAMTVAGRFQDILRLLQEQPYAAQMSRTGRVRRFAAAPFPYVIYYRIEQNFILIVGVRHGARQIPKSWR
jgi:plasmid stabilization system protein ParE